MFINILVIKEIIHDLLEHFVDTHKLHINLVAYR